MLTVDALHAFYGKSHVLRGVQLQVRSGEIVSLLGRNGAGRSTTAKAIMGLTPARGSVRWHGTELLGQPTHAIARLGVGYVPESRDVFSNLTVRQNLLLGTKPAAQAWTSASPRQWGLGDMLHMFPALQERLDTPAGVLSGGEQQMLTLCRTLMGNPGLMLVDEPTEGLAPQLVQQVARCLCALRDHGMAVLLVEQKLAIALQVSQRCLVMGHGQVVFEGTSVQLMAASAVRREWLEV